MTWAGLQKLAQVGVARGACFAAVPDLLDQQPALPACAFSSTRFCHKVLPPVKLFRPAACGQIAPFRTAPCRPWRNSPAKVHLGASPPA